MNKQQKRLISRIITISSCIITILPFLYSLLTIYVPYDQQNPSMKKLCQSSLYIDYRPFKIEVPQTILDTFQIKTDDTTLLCVTRPAELFSTRILPSITIIVISLLSQYKREQNDHSISVIILYAFYIINATFLFIETISNLFRFLYTIGKCPHSVISIGTTSPIPFADDCYMIHFILMIVFYFCTSSLHCILSIVYTIIHFKSYPDSLGMIRYQRRRIIVDNDVIDDSDLQIDSTNQTDSNVLTSNDHVE